jgi:hypothetical protein
MLTYLCPRVQKKKQHRHTFVYCVPKIGTIILCTIHAYTPITLRIIANSPPCEKIDTSNFPKRNSSHIWKLSFLPKLETINKRKKTTSAHLCISRSKNWYHHTVHHICIHTYHVKESLLILHHVKNIDISNFPKRNSSHIWKLSFLPKLETIKVLDFIITSYKVICGKRQLDQWSIII